MTTLCQQDFKKKDKNKSPRQAGASLRKHTILVNNSKRCFECARLI